MYILNSYAYTVRATVRHTFIEQEKNHTVRQEYYYKF